VSSRPTQFDREQREVEFSRALAFSDGVFAFAVTLLVTTLDVPRLSGPDQEHQLWEALKDLQPSFLGYAISFAAIGLMWLQHHRLFSRIRRIDATVLWLNLVSLAFVVLIPFTTELMGTYSGLPLAVSVYALNFALAITAYSLLWWYCVRHDMLDAPLTPQALRIELISRGWIIGGFLLSIPIAFASTGFAKYFWAIIGFTQWRLETFLTRRAERRAGDASAG
jgi:uncharacterized membrane protein